MLCANLSKAKLGKKIRPHSQAANLAKSARMKGVRPANLEWLHTHVRGQKRPKLSLKRLGAANPNWQGGKTRLSHACRHLLPYRIWRTTVFERDDYTCQLCGVRGGKLEADHHPMQFSELLRLFNIQTVLCVIVCSDLWKPELGRTLCKPCHKDVTHRKQRSQSGELVVPIREAAASSQAC